MTPDERIEDWKARSPLPGLVWPDYTGGCVAHIPEIVRAALGRSAAVPERFGDLGPPADRVVLVILDGLGYHALARYRGESSLLDGILRRARLEVLTSTFPSTTPAALTAVYTGAAPRQHGLAGGSVFLRERGGPAHMVRFSPLDDPRRDSLLETGLDLKAFCPVTTVFEGLGRRMVRFAWMPAPIRDNALCRICTAGAEVRPFLTPAQAVVGIRKALQSNGASFQCLYWDAADSMSHARGPYSEEVRAEVVSFMALLERELLDTRVGDRARVFLTADHGQMPVARQSALSLDAFPEIRRCLMAPPLGSHRVPYLMAAPGREEELRRACRPLEERFFVLDSQEMLASGLFGIADEHPEIRYRIGTLILMPRADGTLYRAEPVYFSGPVRGDHDGLSAEEMVVPLLTWDIGDGG